MPSTAVERAIADRLVAIQRGVLGHYAFEYIPPDLQASQLPAWVNIPGNTTYARETGNVYLATQNWQMRLYLVKAGMGLRTVNERDYLSIQSDVRNAFMMRHALQYNDTGLSYVRSAQLISAQGLVAPVSYPEGSEAYYLAEFFTLRVEFELWFSEQGF